MRADACVIGLGGSGLACIDEFQRHGASVVGIDAGTVGGAAAGRNGGLLRAGGSVFHHEARSKYGAERAARIYATTMYERDRIVERLPSVARRCGYLRLAHDDEEARDCEVHLRALNDDGFPAEWYDGPLGRGMFVRDDAVIDPLARCRLEAAGVQRNGAQLFEKTPALSLSSGVVETAAGVVRCEIVVVAVDGVLAAILPELQDRVWPVRLQMLASSRHEPGALPHAIGTRWGWDYAQQLPDGTIAFGGCRDVGGQSERTTEALPTPVVQSALDRRFTEVMGAAPAVTHRWAAIAGYTADGLPLIEHVRPGIWAVGGYSGTGNLLGAACGRVAVQLALSLRTDSLLD